MPDLKPVVLNPPLNVTLIRDQAGLDKLKDFFQREKVIGWDIETNPLKDYFYRRTRTWQFGNNNEQYVIDLRAFVGDDADALYKAQGYYGLNVPESLKPVLEVTEPVLCSAEWLKVGVSLGFEYQNTYWQFGLRTFHFYDCGMAERAIWAGALGSMKMYAFFSMEEMMARYFLVQIDKGLQESFNLESPLTPDQVQYAALDTRFPLAIRAVQAHILAGETPQSLLEKKLPGAGKQLSRLPQFILGDDLRKVVDIENDAIGAFEDMHIHGERLDREKWLARVARKKVELAKVIADELDPIFIPIVGNKTDLITDEKVAEATAKWKAFNEIPEVEIVLKAAICKAKRAKSAAAADLPQLQAELASLADARKVEKEHWKHICSELKKKRTKINKLADKCEGKALINYGSRTQLLNVLNGMKGLERLKDTEDETLEKYKFPVTAALRKFRTLSKIIGTYGDAWATIWTTKACKEEGWLHPGDGRLHCRFNQYDAETGRSTSEKPNGQNIEKDVEVRSCFIADPPDEEEPEGYVIVTADMSGAELRILAECAKEPVWIDAFNRDEDVHAVCTELMYPEKWPNLALPNCAYFALHTEETVAKNPLCVLGTPQKQKCKCPEHGELRDGTKPVNFGVPYGISPPALAVQIHKPQKIAEELMALHRSRFARIWAHIDKAGAQAKMLKKAFDIFGRRRLFVEPTWLIAKQKAKEDREERLRFDEEECIRNVANFTQLHNRAPKGKMKEIDSEHYILTHREPVTKEIGNALNQIYGSMERQGKNHEIQATNATIAKLAMGCGFCPEGKPYLWHTLRQYKAKLIKFVHDELVVQCPKRFGQTVAALIGDAFKRAAAERMKLVVMEFDYKIAPYWKK